MANASPYRDWILDYLKDGLSAAEEQEMEAAIEANPQLAQEVAAARELYLAARLHAPGGLHEQLTQLKAAPSARKPHPFLRWGAVAAVALLLFLGIGWWVNRPGAAPGILQTPPPEQLSTDLQAALSGQGMTEAPPYLDSLLAGLEAYRAGDFAQAGAAIEQYHQQAEPIAETQFLLAATYLQTSQPQKAGPLLQAAAEAVPLNQTHQLYWAAWQWAYGNRQAARALKARLAQSENPAIRQQARKRW